MIPEEVENRVAKYFFHNFMPEDVLTNLEEYLLCHCRDVEEEDIDIDLLVYEAVGIIRDTLHGKKLK